MEKITRIDLRPKTVPKKDGGGSSLGPLRLHVATSGNCQKRQAKKGGSSPTNFLEALTNFLSPPLHSL